MNAKSKILCVAALGAAFFAGALAEAGGFQDHVYQEEKTPEVLSYSELHQLWNTQFIFIDGTFGEIWRSNFAPATNVLNSQWRARNFNIIRPHTPNTIPANAEILYNEVSSVIRQSGKPHTVIIAHSKGGAEVLLMALRHPDLVTELGVQAFGIISASIAGTDVIDYVEKACKVPNAICNALNQQLPFLNTYTPAVIQPIFVQALEHLSSSDRAALEPKIFYARTQMQDNNYSSTLWATHEYLRLAHPEQGPNDGLIPTANEVLYEQGFDPQTPVFGTDLGVMIGDHNSLLNHTTFSSVESYREAFFRALIERMLGF